jgi:hypothetical protein
MYADIVIGIMRTAVIEAIHTVFTRTPIRMRRPFTCHSASAIMAAIMAATTSEAIMEATTAVTTSLVSVAKRPD